MEEKSQGQKSACTMLKNMSGGNPGRGDWELLFDDYIYRVVVDRIVNRHIVCT